MRNTFSHIVGGLLIVLGMLTHSEATIYTSDSTVTIGWTAPAGTPPASYNIFTSPDGVNFTQIGSTNNTSYDLNVTAGNTYYTAVQAVSLTGLVGPMSDPSDAIVVVSDSNTLHATYWAASKGYASWALIKNTSDSTIEVTPTIIAYNGASFTDTSSLTIPPHQTAKIYINDYKKALKKQTSGVLEITHTGNPGDVVADMMISGPNGFSLSMSMRDKSASSTTLNATYWTAANKYASWALIKNTSNSVIEVTPTIIAYDGTSYTEPTPLSIPPHQTTRIAMKGYVNALNGRTGGVLEIAHSGNPGDVVANMLIMGPSGYSVSMDMRDNSASSNTLNATHWTAANKYASWALIKNTSNATVQITPTVIANDGAAYTDPTPLSILPHQTARIAMSNYVTALNGKTSGALEITYSGNPGDVVADMLISGPKGYTLTLAMKDNSASSNTLNAAYWTIPNKYTSWALIKNTSNSTIEVTPTLIASDGTSYTEPAPLSIPPHQVATISINNYKGLLNNQSSGSLEIAHTGNPGDVVANVMIAGPGGFSYSTDMR